VVRFSGIPDEATAALGVGAACGDDLTFKTFFCHHVLPAIRFQTKEFSIRIFQGPEKFDGKQAWNLPIEKCFRPGATGESEKDNVYSYLDR